MGAAATALPGCGGGGGVEAAAIGGPNRVRLADPNGLLGTQSPTTQALATDAVARAAQALPVTGVTVTLIPDAQRAIAGWGFGGRTFSATAVELYIDPAQADLAQRLPERLPPLVTHELHHAVRWRGPGYGRTLLEAMVSEGLADRFAVELLGTPVPPWSDAFARDQTGTYLDLARPEFDSTAYSHERWFFEAGQSQLPRWTGYTLGWRLVEAYQASNPGRSAAALVDTPASAFRPG
jgi:hypothetical protein